MSKQDDLMEEFDPLFNAPNTPAEKRLNENDKILDAFGIKKEPVATTTTKVADNNPFADFADLGVQPVAPANNNPAPLNVNNLLMEGVDSKTDLNSSTFPVMSAEMLCPVAPNTGNNSK